MLRKIAFFIALSVLTPSLVSAADYVRDEVRVNMRSGPGTEFRIERTLMSGDKLRRLDEKDGWILVRVGGDEGWVPERFVTQEAPSSVVLPGVQQKLESAEGKIGDLETQLTAQASAIEELDFLRARNVLLEEENRFWSDSRKNLVTGAAIAAVFLLLGFLWQGSSTAAKRGSGIKL